MPRRRSVMARVEPPTEAHCLGKPEVDVSEGGIGEMEEM
jgi:hypothetical protein